MSYFRNEESFLSYHADYKLTDVLLILSACDFR
jgi:hypothetical protein